MQFQDDILAIVQLVKKKNFLALNEGSAVQCSYPISVSILTLLPSCLLVILSWLVLTLKYLGVILSSDMSWSPHINKINAKTRRLIGLFYRCFYFCTPSTLVTFYTSFIHPPHLEYASAVWNPYLYKDIDLLDKTQTFALRVCLKNWSLSYDILHSQLNLPSCWPLLHFQTLPSLQDRQKSRRLPFSSY